MHVALVSIYPIRVFGEHLETSVPQLTGALHWAIAQNLDVVNLSLGTRLPEALEPLYVACEKARRQGMIVVAAQHNINDWSYPAIFENVIGVETGSFKNPYHFYDQTEEAIECVAKSGASAVRWLGGHRKVLFAATSFAAPHITGIVALLRERYPGATLEKIRSLLAKYAIGQD